MLERDRARISTGERARAGHDMPATSTAFGVDEAGSVHLPGVLFERPAIAGRALSHVEDLGMPAMGREPLDRLLGTRRPPERDVVALAARGVGVRLAPCLQAPRTGQGEA